MDALDRFAAIVPFERRNNDMSRKNFFLFFFFTKIAANVDETRLHSGFFFFFRFRPSVRNGTRRHFFSSVVGRWWNVHQRHPAPNDFIWTLSAFSVRIGVCFGRVLPSGASVNCGRRLKFAWLGRLFLRHLRRSDL